ncbi:hypothetical protein EG328_008323 [Venturia inaequalis]|uniref:Uncharacterized protein n=1 Tax=Venturia inaequalis TaxID=5025 RepID=A0A8H3UB40_VENIN|nr:hypothetical protein EG328_008323 [Venturia inaequalis]
MGASPGTQFRDSHRGKKGWGPWGLGTNMKKILEVSQDATAFRAAFGSTQSSYAVRALMVACRATSPQGLSVPEAVYLSQITWTSHMVDPVAAKWCCKTHLGPAPWFAAIAMERMWRAGIFGNL